MKWGIVFSSTGFPDPDSAVALARAAEQAGFESLWSPEHVVMSKHPDATPYRGSPDGSMARLARRGGIPDPLIWFAYVASATSRIRFGTGVLILPEHQPVVLAKSAATLDHLCGGRLLLGVGVGDLPEVSRRRHEFRRSGPTDGRVHRRDANALGPRHCVVPRPLRRFRPSGVPALAGAAIHPAADRWFIRSGDTARSDPR